jgi:restriction endonuclease S subunit
MCPSPLCGLQGQERPRVGDAGELGQADLRRFKKYPAYKDSGVEWLGHIPAHWEVNRTKFAARLRSGHTPSRQHAEYWVDCTIPWFGLADVWQIRDGHREYVNETSEKISELGLANSAARLLPKGTVILSRTASVGFSAILGVDMATTQDFVNWVCGPRLRPEYLLYVFRSMQHEFQRLTMGSTHQTIYMPDVGGFCTPIPPISEQDRTVAFVRERTKHIDALVAKNERLVELLQEMRTALITRAVTKGLDPNASMKDSGVEWLGEIPAHWDVMPLKHVAHFINGFPFKPDEWSPEGTPIIRIENLNGGESFNCTARELPARYCAEKDDLLFGWSGNRGTSFGPFLRWRNGIHYVNQHIFRVVDYDVHKLWLYWVLRGVTFYVEKQAHGDHRHGPCHPWRAWDHSDPGAGLERTTRDRTVPRQAGHQDRSSDHQGA